MGAQIEKGRNGGDARLMIFLWPVAVSSFLFFQVNNSFCFWKNKDWATKLTDMAENKHHIGDFLPPHELKKFMETYKVNKFEQNFKKNKILRGMWMIGFILKVKRIDSWHKLFAQSHAVK